jgi:dTDP-4-dehydrorhamnose reductase
LAAQSSAHQICYTYFRNDPVGRSYGIRLDIRDEAEVRALIGEFRPTVIIHTVGSNRGADVEAVIRQGTKFITQSALEHQSRLIHLSTDVVFDGLNAPYDESALPSPVTGYGRAKSDAESMVGEHDDHVIIRTSLIYGLRQMDRGTKWMAEALRAGRPVHLFNNQRRNPVWIDTLCHACLELATSRFKGILNVAGSQALSRADFALKLLDWWKVRARDSLSIGPAIGGEWPLDCELELGLAKRVLNTPLLGVDDVLQQPFVEDSPHNP